MLAVIDPTKPQLIEALGVIERLGPSPILLAQAPRLLRDPRSHLADLAALIGSDGAVAADIIRCANRTLHGMRPCESIGEAMHRIGLRATLRLLSLAVARRLVSRDLACYRVTGSDYWAESLFHGLFMEALAAATGEADPDEAYAVGLLRFIGRLAINQAIESCRTDLLWDGSLPIDRWERDNVGLVQAQAGARLLRRWGFAVTMVDAVAGQDQPHRAERNWLAGALHFAATVLPRGIDAPFRTPAGLAPPATATIRDFMQRHRLSPVAMNDLLRTTTESFERVRRQLES